MNLDRIAKWEEKFLHGDHSDDAWLVAQLREVQAEPGAGPLFRAASTVVTLEFLRDSGVSIIQRDENGLTFLMELSPPLDIEVYCWLANEFAAQNAIDLADDEGFTALSSMIKFAELDKARILLERGASIDTVAFVARYGGARLTIPRQAVICMPLDDTPPEAASIAALQLLQEFGYRPATDDAQTLLDSVGEDKLELREWIAKNLF